VINGVKEVMKMSSVDERSGVDTGTANKHDIELTERERETIEYAVESDWELGEVLKPLL
jgi:hypothetical protein